MKNELGKTKLIFIFIAFYRSYFIALRRFITSFAPLPK